MTNADVIRQMTDDELYEFLSEWECGDIDYAVTFCDLCNDVTKRGKVGNVLNLDCDGCRKHWLTRDADEYGGLRYWERYHDFTDCKTEPKLCRECEEYAGNGMYCASNHLVYDFDTCKDEPQTDTHDIRTETHECVKDTHDKDEPNCSEIPNTCKTEPQTSGVVWTEDAIKNEPKSYTTWASTDETQTERSE